MPKLRPKISRYLSGSDKESGKGFVGAHEVTAREWLGRGYDNWHGRLVIYLRTQGRQILYPITENKGEWHN